MLKTTALLLILISVCGTALADQASHRKSAEDLLTVFDFENAMMAGVNASLEMQIQNNPTLLPYRDVFQEWAKSFLTWEVAGPPLVDLYVATFTEQELCEMKAFYETPTGQKAFTSLGTVMQEASNLGLRLAGEHQQELKEMIQKRAQDLEKRPSADAGGTASK